MPTYTAVPAATARTELGESPLWDAHLGLRWLDVPGRRLHTLANDGSETSVSLTATVTAVELSTGPALLAVTSTGFGWLDPDRGRVTEIARVLGRDDTIAMNDGGIDPYGRCWAGSAVRDQSRGGVLYRLTGDTVTAHADRIGMSNGIDWSPDGDLLYHVDSTAGTVTAWGFRLATGELGEPRVLRTVPPEVGLPDGLTVDADGQVWVAVWGTGQVWRLHPGTGHTTAAVEVPTPYPTSCAFGGDDLTTLYVTTANYQRRPGGGGLYAAETGVRGRHPYRFAGAPR